MKRKICVVSGSRAEYGLLRWLMKEIEKHPKLELQIIATASHLSPGFGLTYKNIEEDGFLISAKVEMLLSTDTATGISKSIGIGIMGFSDAYERLNPDLIVLLGDRFEIMSAALAALVARIPIAHIHGGETTEGAIDEAIRHSVTKMGHLHFTSTENYRNRVIQLGENPERVFNFGALASDSLRGLELLDQDTLEEELHFRLGKKNLIVTFHPATLEKDGADKQIGELLAALRDFPEIHLIFTMPNADPGNSVIRSLIANFVANFPNRAISCESLGQLRYFSLMRLVDGVIGNSSSGLIEAPSFRIGTINIGSRQSGRIKAASVIDCAPSHAAIAHAIRHLYSSDFRATLVHVQNPYDNGPVANRIASVLAEFPLENLLAKQFFNHLAPLNSTYPS